MRFWKIGLVVLLIGCLLIGCTQMSAEEIAKKVEEKYNAVKDMKGEVVITTEINGTKRVEVIKFTMKKPDKFWQEGDNYTIVSNGKTMWVYDKRRNEVVKVNLPEKRPKFDYGEIIKDLLKRNEVKLLGSDKVDGRNCYVIEVIPKNKKTFYVEQKLWIDKEYWYPLKIEINYGEFNSTIEYKDVKFNIGILDSFFEFKLPKGVKYPTVSRLLVGLRKRTRNSSNLHIQRTCSLLRGIRRCKRSGF